MRRRLKNWREVLPTLPNPKERPNDYYRLILSCKSNGMNTRDIMRVFGVSQFMVDDISKKFRGIETVSDREYFIDRARKLGADDEAINQWFK